MRKASNRDLHGWLVIDKPSGITSARAVALVRRSTGAKTGHAGTLDPLATGILPIASARTTGPFDPSAGSSRMAMPASTSSRIGYPADSAPSNFMPSFASEPPATTTTRCSIPASISAAATAIAWTGAAQNDFTSIALAAVRSHDSAIAFATLPPPR